LDLVAMGNPVHAAGVAGGSVRDASSDHQESHERKAGEKPHCPLRQATHECSDRKKSKNEIRGTSSSVSRLDLAYLGLDVTTTALGPLFFFRFSPFQDFFWLVQPAPARRPIFDQS
jgi:hypothetical protein